MRFNDHIYTFIYKHKKTTLFDWSVSCNVMLQAVEASRVLVVKSDALLTLINFLYINHPGLSLMLLLLFCVIIICLFLNMSSSYDLASNARL